MIDGPDFFSCFIIKICARSQIRTNGQGTCLGPGSFFIFIDNVDVQIIFGLRLLNLVKKKKLALCTLYLRTSVNLINKLGQNSRVNLSRYVSVISIVSYVSCLHTWYTSNGWKRYQSIILSFYSGLPNNSPDNANYK